MSLKNLAVFKSPKEVPLQQLCGPSRWGVPPFKAGLKTRAATMVPFASLGTQVNALKALKALKSLKSLKSRQSRKAWMCISYKDFHGFLT